MIESIKLIAFMVAFVVFIFLFMIPFIKKEKDVLIASFAIVLICIIVSVIITIPVNNAFHWWMSL